MKIVKKMVALLLATTLFILGSTTAYATANTSVTEGELIRSLITSALPYFDNNMDLLVNRILEEDISNMKNLDDYLDDIGSSIDARGDIGIQNVLSAYPDLIAQEEIEWSVWTMLYGSVEEDTSVHSVLRDGRVKDVYGYYKEIYDRLLPEVEWIVSNQAEREILFTRLFCFYINYCFFYHRDIDRLIEYVNGGFDSYVQAQSIHLLDLDDSNTQAYDNVTVEKSISKKNRKQIIKSDVINISLNNLDKYDVNYLKQLVENGSTMVVQSDGDNSKGMVEGLIGTNVIDAVQADNSVLMGYAVTFSGADFVIEPISASLLQMEGDTAFDLESELIEFENSLENYIDPINLYSSNKEKLNEQGNTIKSNAIFADGSLVAYLSGVGYLYGKKKEGASWLNKSGYVRLAYYHGSFVVTNVYTFDGKMFDQIKGKFSISGQENTYIKEYQAQMIGESGTHIKDFGQLNENTTAEIATSFGFDGNAPSYNITYTSQINPSGQCITTSSGENHVKWKAQPNSHMKETNWRLEADILTETHANVIATVGVGLSEFVVDGSYGRFTSPCGIGQQIKYKNHTQVN